MAEEHGKRSTASFLSAVGAKSFATLIRLAARQEESAATAVDVET
jgi:hypothetical protein